MCCIGLILYTLVPTTLCCGQFQSPMSFDEDEGKTHLAAQQLADLPATLLKHELPRVADALKDNSFEVRSLALRAIKRLGPDAEPIIEDIFTAFWKEKDTATKSAFEETLPYLGKASIIRLSRIISNTKETATRRLQAVMAMGRFHNLSQDAINSLEPALQDKDKDIAFYGAQQILLLNKNHGPAVALMVTIFEDPHNAFSGLAGDALIPTKEKGRVVPLYVALYRQKLATGEKPTVYDTNTLYNLCQLGTEAKAVAPLLSEYLQKHVEREGIGRNTHVYWACTILMMDSSSEQGRAFFRQSLEVLEIAKNREKNGSRLDTLWQPIAIDVLGNLGPSAREALPILEPLLEAPDSRIRHAAIEAIKKIRISNGGE